MTFPLGEYLIGNRAILCAGLHGNRPVNNPHAHEYDHDWYLHTGECELILFAADPPRWRVLLNFFLGRDPGTIYRGIHVAPAVARIPAGVTHQMRKISARVGYWCVRKAF